MDLKNLPWWGQALLALAFCGALVFSQYKMAPLNLGAKQRRIENLESKLAQTQAQIHKGRQAQAKLDELQRDIAALERKLTDLRQILPTEPELGDLLKWIKSLADQTNLELEIFNPQSLTDVEFLREQPIQMQVAGTYHQLGMFFDRISKYARIINVENVNVSPAGRGTARATIGATFTAKTFIYREQAAASGGGV
jgi:type IV pilus assembly protein PilO